MRPSAFAFFFLALSLAVPLGGTACGGDPEPASPESIYVIPKGLDELSGVHFYDLPYPHDARRESDGSIRVAGFYNPFDNAFVRDVVEQSTRRLKGFALAGGQFFRFTDAIDAAALPTDPGKTLDPLSTIQIVNIDRASSEFGKRTAATVLFRKGGPNDVYYLPNTLTVMPALGVPLLPNTRYATLVRRGLRNEAGKEFTACRGVRVALGLESPALPEESAHRALFSDLPGTLGDLGVPASDVLSFTVFRTDDPRREVTALADFTRTSFQAPTIPNESWSQKETNAAFDVYEGLYGPSPTFQEGTPPYRDSGGDFVFDPSGRPIVQGTFNLRFVMVIPNAEKCPPPANGYPMVIYAHGTGGDYRSVVREGSGAATLAATRCMAAIGTDQIYHGTRPGAADPNDPRAETDTELAFFNLLNLRAGRTNPGQSAIDIVQEARLFTVSNVAIPANISRTGSEIRFDPSNLTFMGHSQGGINGPIALAVDDQIRGGVFSGTGATFIISLIDKTQPEPAIRGITKAFLGLYTPETEGELSLFHPALTLGQNLIEIGDPLSYMRSLVIEPRPGFAPKSILQTEGVNPDGTGDNYTPVRAIEAGAVIMGLPVIAPPIHPFVSYRDAGSVTLAADGPRGNLAGGKASGALAQFSPQKRDGHFVAFEIAAANRMVGNFLRDLADDPAGRLRSP